MVTGRESLLLEQCPDAIFAFTKILAWCPVAEIVVGYARAQAVGRMISDLIVESGNVHPFLSEHRAICRPCLTNWQRAGEALIINAFRHG